MPQTLGVLAPSGRDAAVIDSILHRAEIPCQAYPNIPEIVAAIAAHQAGAVIVAEEAFGTGDLETMQQCLAEQPLWSDLPFVLLTKRGGNSLAQAKLATSLGNVTILERPFSPVTLVSAARAALRVRARQHQTESHIAELAARERDLLVERARLEVSEARLREANEKLGRRFAESLAAKRVLADVVEGTDAFVQVADLNYRWMAINRAAADEFERIFGVRPEVGQSMLDVLEHLPEHRQAVQAVWSRALAGEEFTETGEFGRHERERRTYEMKYNSLRNERGERIGAYQFVYDVTDRVQEQRQLAEAQARMHEMAKLETLGQLTGGVAHDFNNLLTPIVGALDILHRRHEDDPRSLRLITGALEAAQRATILVQRLLSFARRQHLEARAIDVGELINGMRDLIQRSIGPHVGVVVAIEPDLPAARIDPNQLELSVLNLAVNASDAMPGGGSLSIDVSQQTVAKGEVEGLASGPYIRLAVSDTGTGMDEATIKRSIEPFFTTKGVGKGTGLGLSMVHGLAAQSGGTLRIRSVPGGGTTAEIWLPVSGGVADPVEPLESATPMVMRRSVVVMVDDEELVRRATAEMLREMGHEVLEASSALAALDKIRERQDIEVVVSDYLMPGMRGDELIEQARRIRPDIKSLLITGYSKLVGAESNNLTRLSKPFRAVDLAHEVEKLLTDRNLVDLASRRRRPG